MAAHRKISIEQEQYIYENRNRSARSLAREFGITEYHITTIWRKHGYFARKESDIIRAENKQKRIEYIKEHWKDLTVSQMARDLSTHPSVISLLMKDLGLRKDRAPIISKTKNSAIANCEERPRACFECPLDDCRLVCKAPLDSEEIKFLRIGLAR